MDRYNYHDVVKELIDNGVISGYDVYDYSEYQHPIIFDKYFQFCQKNLSEVCVENDYNIQPAKIYFTTDTRVNASAGHGRVYYVIKINRGVLHELYSLFYFNDILDDPELAEYKEFGEFLENSLDAQTRVPLSFLLAQNGTLFTYYHELGHLIQLSQEGTGKAMLSEQYIDNEEDKFDPLKHILEFDADQHGASNLAFHINNLFQKLPADAKTEETMKKLIIVSLVGVIGYIFFLWRSINQDMYYDKSTHPHPLIRIAWISSNIIDVIQKNVFPNLDQREILDETFKVLDIYLDRKGQGDIKTRFKDPIRDEYENIMGYCQAVLQWSEKIPYLVVNTIHKRDRK